MAYVDGFVLPAPKKNVQAYRRMASKSRNDFRIGIASMASAAVAIAGHDYGAGDDEVHRRKGFKGHVLSPTRAGAQACGF
jgi:uncharacterized protein YbaA (DUF1428 family)